MPKCPAIVCPLERLFFNARESVTELLPDESQVHRRNIKSVELHGKCYFDDRRIFEFG